jgi:hypothetical protein
MKILGPERYQLSFNAKAFTVECSKGTTRFSGLGTSRLPKLYVISVEGQPVYVGITRQSIRTRFRIGFNAIGENGYHGYAWRHSFTAAKLYIWAHADAPAENQMLDMETVEAEIVFLIRCSGQWPASQTEIHFHPSTQTHREIAATIWREVSTAQGREGLISRSAIRLKS